MERGACSPPCTRSTDLPSREPPFAWYSGGVKRKGKNSLLGPKRGPKLPDELHPIVDAVVEIVFERLRSAATTRNVSKAPPQRRKTAKLNLPLPKQRTALAEALADLLLKDLASGASSRSPRSGKALAKGAPRRGSPPPRSGRAR